MNEAVKMPPDVPLMAVSALRPDPRNPRTHDEAQVRKLVTAIREVGWTNPILVDGDMTILAGHGRLMAAKMLGLDAVPVLVLPNLTPEQRKLVLIGDNRLAEDAGWDREALAVLLREIEEAGLGFEATGFGDAEIEAILREANQGGGDAPAAGDGAAGGGSTPTGAGSLAARFGVPPFSVLNAREGWWQERKRAWLALGIRSEVGRGGNLLNFSETLMQPDPAKRAAAKAERAA